MRIFVTGAETLTPPTGNQDANVLFMRDVDSPLVVSEPKEIVILPS